MDPICAKLESVVKPTLDREGFELVDLVVKGNRLSRIIQFFVDRQGGITVEDCAHLNRKLSNLLEGEDIDCTSLKLEVSSPGTDRPLKTEKDFRRNVGRNVSVFFLSEGEKKRVVGTILQTNSDSVCIKAENQTLTVPFTSLIEGRIKLKW